MVGVHAHVQRRVLGVGEAALGDVELHGRDAEVEQHAVDAGQRRATSSTSRHPVVDGVDEVDARGEAGQPAPAARQRVRVAVEPDEGELRVRGEQRLGVPAEAERGVDDDRRPVGERRGEQGEHPVEQHGDVHGRVGARAGCRPVRACASS